jgi:hypothetical protein
MKIISTLISILSLRSGFLQINDYKASELAKLIGCLQAAETDNTIKSVINLHYKLRFYDLIFSVLNLKN